MRISPRIQFLIKNGAKGVAWMAVLLAAYFLFKDLVLSNTSDEWVQQFYAQPEIIYLIYASSEFFFGIIPPELFMIWAFNKADTVHYILNVGFFAVVSYAMGYATFLIGQFFYKKATFRFIRRKFLSQQWPLIHKYGLFLIIVAALTPIPWAAVTLLVGSAGYPSKRYLKYALFRFVRFIVYGFIIFQTHQI